MSDNGVFDKIAKKLNTEFKEENPEKTKTIEKISTDIQEFEDKKNELIESTKNQTLEDKNYLQTEIKGIVDCGKNVLEKLQNEIKVGSSARIYEVYADLMNSVINGLKELRELNKTVYDIETINDDLGQTSKPANINIVMDAKELLKHINDAKQKNELNAIDAEFTVEGEIKRESKREDNGKVDGSSDEKGRPVKTMIMSICMK